MPGTPIARTQPDRIMVAAVRRLSAASAASGRSQSRYHGTSQALHSRIAKVAQPAMRIGSLPRHVRHSVQPATAANASANTARTASRLTDRSSAVLYGRLKRDDRPWFDDSSENALNTSVPKPSSPSATSSSAARAAPATKRQNRGRDPRARYGTTSAAEALTPAASVDQAPAAAG